MDTKYELKRDARVMLFHGLIGYLKGIADHSKETVPQRIKFLIDKLNDLGLEDLTKISIDELEQKYYYKSFNLFK